MAKKEKSTNAARLLEQAKIAIKLHEYDENAVDGEKVAEELHEDPSSVFKSLVAHNEKNDHFIFEVPVNRELDLKKAAKATSSKWVELIPLKGLLPLTGYVHGGCSPVGLKKRMPCYLDESALSKATIFISAGKRGMQMELDPRDLVAYLKAVVCQLASGE